MAAELAHTKAIYAVFSVNPKEAFASRMKE